MRIQSVIFLISVVVAMVLVPSVEWQDITGDEFGAPVVAPVELPSKLMAIQRFRTQHDDVLSSVPVDQRGERFIMHASYLDGHQDLVVWFRGSDGYWREALGGVEPLLNGEYVEPHLRALKDRCWWDIK